MRKVTTHEAKTHLSRLLTEVGAGEEIVIYRGNQPAARLVPVTEAERRRSRPVVGTRTSDGVQWDAHAFEPLSDAELEREWGL
jgi:prevent-host-death family protein